MFIAEDQPQNIPFFVVRKEMYFLRPFCISVNRTEDEISVRYSRRLERDGRCHDFTVAAFQLKLDELKKRPDWKDCTQFGLHFKQYDVDYMLACSNMIDQCFMQGMSPDDVIEAVEAQFPRFGTVNRNGYLINISAALQNGRVSSVEGHALIPAYRMLNFTAKFKDTKFTDMMVSMNIDPKCPFYINEPLNKIYEVINSLEIYRHLRTIDPVVKELVKRPRLRLTLMTEEEVALHVGSGHPAYPGYWIKCQLVWEWDEIPIEHEAEVYLEEVVGYLPKKRLYLNEYGVGYFNVLPIGLIPQDRIRVKAGFRFHPGMTDIEFPIRYEDTFLGVSTFYPNFVKQPPREVTHFRQLQPFRMSMKEEEE